MTTETLLTTTWQSVASGVSRVTAQARGTAEIRVDTSAPAASAVGFVLNDLDNFSHSSFTGKTLYARRYAGTEGSIVVLGEA